MLLEKPLTNGDTVSFKLASGEEVVARLDSLTASKYVVEKPLMLTMNKDGLALAPFMFTIEADAKITFDANNVLCASRTEKEMAKQYLSRTSNLVLV